MGRALLAPWIVVGGHVLMALVVIAMAAPNGQSLTEGTVVTNPALGLTLALAFGVLINVLAGRSLDEGLRRMFSRSARAPATDGIVVAPGKTGRPQVVKVEAGPEPLDAPAEPGEPQELQTPDLPGRIALGAVLIAGGAAGAALIGLARPDPAWLWIAAALVGPMLLVSVWPAAWPGLAMAAAVWPTVVSGSGAAWPGIAGAVFLVTIGMRLVRAPVPVRLRDLGLGAGLFALFGWVVTAAGLAGFWLEPLAALDTVAGGKGPQDAGLLWLAFLLPLAALPLLASAGQAGAKALVIQSGFGALAALAAAGVLQVVRTAPEYGVATLLDAVAGLELAPVVSFGLTVIVDAASDSVIPLVLAPLALLWRVDDELPWRRWLWPALIVCAAPVVLASASQAPAAAYAGVVLGILWVTWAQAGRRRPGVPVQPVAITVALRAGLVGLAALVLILPSWFGDRTLGVLGSVQSLAAAAQARTEQWGSVLERQSQDPWRPAGAGLGQGVYVVRGYRVNPAGSARWLLINDGAKTYVEARGGRSLSLTQTVPAPELKDVRLSARVKVSAKVDLLVRLCPSVERKGSMPRAVCLAGMQTVSPADDWRPVSLELKAPDTQPDDSPAPSRLSQLQIWLIQPGASLLLDDLSLSASDRALSLANGSFDAGMLDWQVLPALSREPWAGNPWLALYVEAGLAGAVLFVLMVGYVSLRMLGRQGVGDAFPPPVIGALIAFVCAGLSSQFFNRPEQGFVIMLLLVLTLCSSPSLHALAGRGRRRRRRRALLLHG